MFSLTQNFQTPPPPPMASTLFELKLKITSAKDLKNVNWRHGSLKPSVSAWVEPTAKSSTKVDHDGDTSPSWNETLHIPVTSAIDDSALFLEILHDKSEGEDDTEPLVGSARLSLLDVVDDVGFGCEAFRTLNLSPQGTVDVEISVKDLQDSLYSASDQYYAGAARFARLHFRSPVEQSAHAYQESTYGQEGPYEKIEAEAKAVKVLDLGEIGGALDGLDPLEGSIAKTPDLTRASDRYDSDSDSDSEASPKYHEFRPAGYGAYSDAPSVHEKKYQNQEPTDGQVDEDSDIECKLSNARVFALAP